MLDHPQHRGIVLAAAPAVALTSLKRVPFVCRACAGILAPRGRAWSTLNPTDDVDFELIHVAHGLRATGGRGASGFAGMRAHPGLAPALLLLGSARHARDAAAAVGDFIALATAQPDFAVIRLELGRPLHAAGRHNEAGVALERALELAPDLARSVARAVAGARARGDTSACDASSRRFEKLAPEEARLTEAAGAARQRSASRLPKHCCSAPSNTRGGCRRAGTSRTSRRRAETTRGRAAARGVLRLAPGCSRARADLVQVLQQQMRGEPMLPLSSDCWPRSPAISSIAHSRPSLTTCWGAPSAPSGPRGPRQRVPRNEGCG